MSKPGPPDETEDRAARKARRAARRAAEAANAEAANAGAAAPAAPGPRPDPAELLGDIDAWGLRQEGDWLRFTARLEAEPRAYQRPAGGGDIIADAPGPLMAVLGIGGPRAAGFIPGPARFRWNILAPADHIFAVGMEGTAAAGPRAGLQRIPHRTAEALLADALLARRHAAYRALPLVFVRTETDSAALLLRLANGVAMVNFTAALDSLCLAARSLGRPARVLAVRIDYGLEDVASDPADLLEGWRGLMETVTLLMRQRGLAPPVFLFRPESGTARIADHAAIHAGWELAWNAGPHRLAMVPPAYAFEADAFGRPSDAGRAAQAQIEALALDEMLEGRPWACPVPLLAEGGAGRIEVTFSALADLVVDAADPFAAGPAAGFRLVAGGRDIALGGVAVNPRDRRRLLLDCGAFEGPAVLYHACNLVPRGDGRAINRSAIRDGWSAAFGAGRLHRWALPAALPVHPAAATQGMMDGL